MTHSDPDPMKYALRLRAVNEYTGQDDYDTRFTVFSGHAAKVGEGLGTLELELPRGIYTIRTERLGEIGKDVLILHEKDEKKTIPAPRRHSAMPSTDTYHTHEFLQAASSNYSIKTTWTNPEAAGDDPLLMILVRATGDGDRSSTHSAASLSLIDEAGVIVTQFEPSRVDGNEAEGWVVFSARLAPGNYILSDIREKRAVYLPILLTQKRWNTLVFVPYEGRPRLSAASIDMCRRDEGYNPKDTFTQQIDATVQGLGMRLDLLPGNLRGDAIYGKFEHPFHGLIGAYAHFLGARRREKLERQVLHNLWRLLEGSTDVIALLLLACEREQGDLPHSMDELNTLTNDAFGETLEVRLPLAFPPLLRISLNTLVRASFDLPDLIAPGSWLESAANSSYADGPWSVWDQENAGLMLEEMPAEVPLAPLSRQKLYPIIKRAIARESTRDAGSIVADDRLDNLLDDQAARIPAIVESIEEEMSDFTFPLGRQAPERLDRVRDLLRQVMNEAEPRMSNKSRLQPDTSVPDWLVMMVHDRMQADGSDYDPVAVARMASVPLTSVQRAAALVDQP